MSSIMRRKWKNKTSYVCQVRRKGFKTLVRSFDTRTKAKTWGRSMESKLDRAHLHFMPYKKENVSDIENSINRSLERRRIGNMVIKFKEYKLVAPDDIDFFFKNNHKDKDYEISGRQYTLKDIKSNYNIKDYPNNINKETLNNNPYIYFDSGFDETSFITFENIETQLGREVVFNIDYYNDERLNNFLDNNEIKYDESKFYWKWQDYSFNNNILDTINLIGTYINKNNIDMETTKYNLKTF